ncbi:acyltransferase [Microlunatus elymi]|uniref:Acyltransferase n=1 Tax=Microlunatus elymi TaxID=2596828 RepID=A0A516PZG7_9ACTN|nr:acyltransferase [Microlunatus elymi]QDP96560.1 acyltransferase [Microlunatus elymi]
MVTATVQGLASRAQGRLRGLDGLRFIAAAGVVAYHYTGKAIGYWGHVAPAAKFPSLNELTRYGFIGVEFFFMISGFVILMTAYGRGVEDFVASRFSRLFPAYWAAVVITVVLQLFWHSGRGLKPVEVFVNFTMMQEGFNIVNAQGAFWTLWVELKFYLLIGIFVLAGITRKRVIAFALIWPVFGQLAAATHESLLVSLLVPTYAPYFAIGMLLYLIYRDGGDIVVWLGVALNLVWCVHHISNYAPKVSKLVGAPVSPMVLSIIVVIMVAAIWSVSAGPLAIIDWRWLTVAGALTYPLYLIHGQFGFFVIDQLHNVLHPYIALLVAFLVSLGLAAALHYGVENTLHYRLRSTVRAALNKVGRTAEVKPKRGNPAPHPEVAPGVSAE